MLLSVERDKHPEAAKGNMKSHNISGKGLTACVGASDGHSCWQQLQFCVCHVSK